MIRFSVIIPTYNRQAYLLACLETVFAQTYGPHEVIVVDDGSTDGTVEALDGFGARIRFIQQSNAGPGAARNRGAQIASGDYIAFLDSDDLWFPWALSTFAELIELHDNPSLLFGRYVDFESGEELKAILAQTPVGDAYPNFLASHSKGYFCGAGMMVISRKAFEKTSGFAEDFLNAEDHDLALQLGTERGFVQVLNPITIGHRVHCDNEMGDTSKTLRGVERLVSREKAGQYPGGVDRSIHRREIIARHTRAAVTGAIRSGYTRDALSLYIATSYWNFRLGRFSYLVAAPLLALASVLRLGSAK